MAFTYLNHAAVYRQGGANHVDVGRGGGALPLGQAAARGWVGRGVVERMRGGVTVGGAVRGRQGWKLEIRGGGNRGRGGGRVHH